MNWPNPTAYHEAIQTPRVCFQDPELKAGAVVTDRLGMPRVASGNFASVYEIRNGSQRWAVRCFLRPVSDQQRRYDLLSKHLSQYELGTLVGFEFLQRGILVRGQWYPVVKMEWVEGEPLQVYVKRHLSDRRTLDKLARQWRGQVVNSLRGNYLAHGDLQHGNVLVTPQGEMRLVDYDGMFVPDLSGEPSPELGHPNFQHPQRTPYDYDDRLDNFAGLVIYTSLLALAEEPGLWQQFNTGENLLTSATDYKAPKQSIVLQRLKRISNKRVQVLADYLEQCCHLPIGKVPVFEDMAAAAQVSAPLPTSGFTTARLQAPPAPITPVVSPGRSGGLPNWLQAPLPVTATRPLPPRPVAPPTNPAVASKTNTTVSLSWMASTSNIIKAVRSSQALNRKTIGIAMGVIILLSVVAYLIIPRSIAYEKFAWLPDLVGHDAEVKSVAFSPDGDMIASGGADAKLILWDAQTKQPNAPLSRNNAAVEAVAFSPDGELVASGRDDFTVILWKTENREGEPPLRGPGGSVKAVAFSPDGKLLAGASADSKVTVWEMQTRTIKYTLKHEGAVLAVAFSPDGKLLASGVADAKIILWDAESGRMQLPPLTRHSDPVTALAFSPDGKLLVSGSGDSGRKDSMVIVWDAQTWEAKQVLRREHKDIVKALAFSPDGSTLVSGSLDGTVKFWDAQTWKVKHELEGAVTSLAFSPDGDLLVCGSVNRLVRLCAEQ